MLQKFFSSGIVKASIAVFTFSVLLKIFFISYSYPYLFHPDESYILKDPFRLIVLYKEFQFTGSSNLLFWVELVFFGFVYLFGLILHQWDSVTGFQNMVITDAPLLYLYGRILSMLLSAAANVFLYKAICKITDDKVLRMLFILVFIFNPIECYANNWVKFDPLCYLYFAFLLNKILDYYNSDSGFYKNKWFYFFLIFGVSLRIDFIIPLGIIFIYDFFYFCKAQKWNWMLMLWKPFAAGLLVYCVITFYPVVMLYKSLHPQPSSAINMVGTFEDVIVKRLVTYDVGLIFNSIIDNLKFYMWVTMLVAFGPVIIGIFILSYKNRHKFYMLGFLFLAYLLALILGIVHGTHYFLMPSVLLLFLSCYFLTQIKSRQFAIVIAVVNLIYVSSIVCQNLYYSVTQKDTRIAAKEFLLKSTTQNDIIAIDKFTTPGFAPPLNECPEVLMKKSELITKYHIGTGETFKLKALLPAPDCCTILDVFPIDFFKSDSTYKGVFFCEYDTVNLAIKNPKYFVTRIPPNDPLDPFANENSILFYRYIKSHYKLAELFENDLPDYRVNLLYPFKKGMYIYSKD